MCPDTNEQTQQQCSAGRRWASDLAAGAILCAFFLFMAGYFVGKRGGVEEVTQRAECDSFADRIYTSFQDLHDNEWHGTASPVTLAELSQPSETSDDMPETSLVAGRVASGIDALSEESIAESGSHYAQLAGFRTAKAATKLSTRLNDRGVPTEVKRRVSRTARGAEHAWYQVVTTAYNDRGSLESVVDRVSREEKISGARIVTC